jgi:hypothetical protein
MSLTSIVRALRRRPRRRPPTRSQVFRPLLDGVSLEARQLLSNVPLHLDFQPSGDPVAPGFTAFGTASFNSTTGYGWTSSTSVWTDDSWTANASPLTQDYAYGNDGTFEVSLPNGTYKVTPTMGDALKARAGITLAINGQTVATGLSSAAGQFLTTTYQATVSNGSLLLHLTGSDANNPYWALNGLDITAAGGSNGSGGGGGATNSTSTTSAMLDFGPSNITVASGYTKVGTGSFSTTTGRGWASSTGLWADDSWTPTATAPSRDYVYGHDGTFKINLANGTYSVTPMLGDALKARDGTTLAINGQTVATGLCSAAGQFLTPTYTVTITNGQLALHLTGTDANHPYWSLDALVIAQSSSSSGGGGSGGGSSGGGGTGSTVTIDSTWLSQHGDTGPFVLNQSNTTYTLATDVDVQGTAFVIAGSNITFNLNGHTVTYGDSAPVSVPNGDFSQGSGGNVPGWDLSQVPGATLVKDTVYLVDPQILQVPNVASTKTITSGNLSIPQTGHTYTATVTPVAVNYGSSMSLSVIDAVTGKVLGTAASRDPNRGFSGVVTFVPTTLDPVKFQVTISPPSGQPTTFYIDSATLTESDDYGIIASNQWSGQVPGFSNLPAAVQSAYGGASNIIIRNGALKQGKANGYGSAPFFAQMADGMTVDTMTTFDTGMDISTLDASDSTGPLLVQNSTFNEAGQNISDRMQDFGTIKDERPAGNITVQNNHIEGSPELGVMLDNNAAGTTLLVKGNDIRQNTMVVNAYAIGLAGVQNFTIDSNTIVPTNGRGIDIDGWSASPVQNGVVSNNYVRVQEAPDREYPNYTDNEARAFRIRNNVDYEGAQHNIQITGNTFIAVTGPGLYHAAYGARIDLVNPTGAMNNANIVFSNNTFEGIVTTTDPNYSATGLLIDGLDPGINLVFQNNVLDSNDTSVGFGGNDNNGGPVADVLLQGNTFSKDTSSVARPYTAVQAGYWTVPVQDVRLIDNQFANGATWGINWIGEGTKDLEVGYTYTAKVVDSNGAAISGATVVATASNGSTLFTETTGSDGLITAVPMVVTTYSQTTSDPSQITTLTMPPCTIVISAGGKTKSLSLSLTGMTTQTVTLS